MWEQDKGFVAWLDQEGLGTDESPLDDEALDLMYRAWKASAAQLKKAADYIMLAPESEDARDYTLGAIDLARELAAQEGRP